MMGTIWIAMLVLSVFSGLFCNKIGELTPAALEGARKSIEICISLSGSLCLWSGLSKLMERSGLTQAFGRFLRPIFRKLFPEAAKDPLALGYLTANISANFLGLGNAATPMGIAAVRRMQQLHGKLGASDEMCRLIVPEFATS